MSALKVLITGGSGLLGQYLNIVLSKSCKILTVYHKNPGNANEYDSARIDITDQKELAGLFKSFQPDIVIHTASVSNNELASSMPRQRVIDINVNATGEIAKLCEKYNAKLFYTSTDLVYDGGKGPMLLETAELKPLSLYAETKLDGEKKIHQVFDNFVILRVALLYGIGLNHSMSHFQKMYENLKEGRNINLFFDQFRSPLSILEAARILSELIKKEISGEIINFGGKERVSRLDMGKVLCKKTGFDPDLIVRTSMYDIEGLPKVADVSMNTSKLQSFGIVLKEIDESIGEVLKYNGGNH